MTSTRIKAAARQYMATHPGTSYTAALAAVQTQIQRGQASDSLGSQEDRDRLPGDVSSWLERVGITGKQVKLDEWEPGTAEDDQRKSRDAVVGSSDSEVKCSALRLVTCPRRCTRPSFGGSRTTGNRSVPLRRRRRQRKQATHAFDH